MSQAAEKTITLPAAEVERIETLVQSGAYSSAGEVIREALIALDEKTSSMEEWLREEVLPAYEEMEAHPERALTAEQVFANLRAHHEKRTRKSA
jgi:antitoxin ParD1/3/4